jgi:cytoskeletal protein CcmA (bactofilin family)
MSAPNAGHIGKAIKIRGQLRGGEDLEIEGRVDGTITLSNNHLTLARSAVVAANIEAQNITICGDVQGNTSATDKVEVTADAKIVGDIRAPRLVMEEGAKFRGQVEMEVKLPPNV